MVLAQLQRKQSLKKIFFNTLVFIIQQQCVYFVSLVILWFEKEIRNVWFRIIWDSGMDISMYATACQTEEQRSSFVVLEAAHSKSDVVSLRALVFSPALFILYVDDHARTLSQGTNHSLYADDLAIWILIFLPLSIDSCSHSPKGPRPLWRMVPEMVPPS